MCVSSNLSYAQTDWMRVLSGTIKAGQAMILHWEVLQVLLCLPSIPATMKHKLTIMAIVF